MGGFFFFLHSCLMALGVLAGRGCGLRGKLEDAGWGAWLRQVGLLGSGLPRAPGLVGAEVWRKVKALLPSHIHLASAIRHLPWPRWRVVKNLPASA